MTVHMSLECVQPLLGRYVRSMVIHTFTGLTLVYVMTLWWNGMVSRDWPCASCWTN